MTVNDIDKKATGKVKACPECGMEFLQQCSHSGAYVPTVEMTSIDSKRKRLEYYGELIGRIMDDIGPEEFADVLKVAYAGSIYTP